MSIDKIWVLAESAEGNPVEHHPRAAHARPLAWAPPRRPWRGGRTPPRWRPSSATTAPRPSTTSGDSGDCTPRCSGGGRHRRARRVGQPPRRILIPATYDGRDIAGRLSVRLDLPVITNVVDLTADGDDVRSQHGLFGGPRWPSAQFTGERPWIFVVRAKSFAAEPAGGGAPAGRARPLSPSSVRPTAPRSSPATSRSAPGPSSTRPRSWFPAAGGSGPPRPTP